MQNIGIMRLCSLTSCPPLTFCAAGARRRQVQTSSFKLFISVISPTMQEISVTNSRVHLLPEPLLSQIKDEIKDLIHSHHCLSRSPYFCLLIGPRPCDGMRRYPLSSLEAPARRCERFPRGALSCQRQGLGRLRAL